MMLVVISWPVQSCKVNLIGSVLSTSAKAAPALKIRAAKAIG